MDQLSSLLRQFSISAGVFYSGQLCGLSDVATGDELVGHIHVLRSGSLSIQSKQQLLNVVAPSLIFFPQPQAHRLIVDEQQPAELVCATIRYDNANHSALANALPEQIVLPLSQHAQFARTIELLFNEAFETDQGSLVIMDKLVEVLVTLLLRHSINQQNKHSGLIAGLLHPKLSLALAALHKQTACEHSVEWLAEQAAMSRTSFIESFKQTIGCSPGDYLVEWKINQAKQLLKRGKPITWVASEVGYQSVSGFTRAFRANTNMSPKQWLDERSSSN
ncbi:putative HTH-type transcriptional regulator [Agarivorans sp. OAG1]|uniref:AraC family transcriptional regulator n=1 Tax=Agarivorans sp. OAG1 TaxID=3082387 RepID=UPI002B2936C1|nr:putative HTH-type transcriptional regulator [Agarivorans sp. OAG1]